DDLRRLLSVFHFLSRRGSLLRLLPPERRIRGQRRCPTGLRRAGTGQLVRGRLPCLPCGGERRGYLRGLDRLSTLGDRSCDRDCVANSGGGLLPDALCGG